MIATAMTRAPNNARQGNAASAAGRTELTTRPGRLAGSIQIPLMHRPCPSFELPPAHDRDYATFGQTKSAQRIRCVSVFAWASGIPEDGK
jgi:hypothetical protein